MITYDLRACFQISKELQEKQTLLCIGMDGLDYQAIKNSVQKDLAWNELNTLSPAAMFDQAPGSKSVILLENDDIHYEYLKKYINPTYQAKCIVLVNYKSLQSCSDLLKHLDLFKQKLFFRWETNINSNSYKSISEQLKSLSGGHPGLIQKIHETCINHAKDATCIWEAETLEEQEKHFWMQNHQLIRDYILDHFIAPLDEKERNILKKLSKGDQPADEEEKDIARWLFHLGYLTGTETNYQLFSDLIGWALNPPLIAKKYINIKEQFIVYQPILLLGIPILTMFALWLPGKYTQGVFLELFMLLGFVMWLYLFILIGKLSTQLLGSLLNFVKKPDIPSTMNLLDAVINHWPSIKNKFILKESVDRVYLGLAILTTSLLVFYMFSTAYALVGPWFDVDAVWPSPSTHVSSIWRGIEVSYSPLHGLMNDPVNDRIYIANNSTSEIDLAITSYNQLLIQEIRVCEVPYRRGSWQSIKPGDHCNISYTKKENISFPVTPPAPQLFEIILRSRNYPSSSLNLALPIRLQNYLFDGLYSQSPVQLWKFSHSRAVKVSQDLLLFVAVSGILLVFIDAWIILSALQRRRQQNDETKSQNAQTVRVYRLPEAPKNNEPIRNAWMVNTAPRFLDLMITCHYM